MATSRERGGRSVTSAPSIAIEPVLASSSPAIMRRSVDLPQPDGPTRTRNSPLPISSETSSTATTSPLKTLPTCSRTISPTVAKSIPQDHQDFNGIDHFSADGYSRVQMSVPQKVTKQSTTREQVLDLIERLGVGNAIPSERQLSVRSEEHTSELQSRVDLVCRLL